MRKKLEWKDLLLSDRRRKSATVDSRDYRNAFENDYDRIVFSAPFRRLQDKAQVFPLERNDFVRTRLTHSIEVAAIARSLGISIANELYNKGLLDEKDKLFIPVILETAGLAHDMGNPPFGHFGEETIRNSFSEWLEKNEIVFSEQQEADLKKFDGNCQMFRILSQLQCIKDSYGMNLTYATLATVMKYPLNSIEGNISDVNRIKEKGVFYKKFGYFYTEEDIATEVLLKTGLKDDDSCYRHPLAFVLEAADDISYLAADLEDGYKKKLFSLFDIQTAFSDNKADDQIISIYNRIQGIIDGKEYYSEEKKLQDIRIFLQGEMIRSVVDAFVDNYDSIMNREFKRELLEVSSVAKIRLTLKSFSQKYILSSPEIEKTELGGEHIIRYLVDRFLKEIGNVEFAKALLDDGEKKLTPTQKRMYDLISKDFRHVFEKKVREIDESEGTESEKINDVLYHVCILIMDFISGMTDGYCTDLFKRLQGLGNN